MNLRDDLIGGIQTGRWAEGRSWQMLLYKDEGGLGRFCIVKLQQHWVDSRGVECAATLGAFLTSLWSTLDPL